MKIPRDAFLNHYSPVFQVHCLNYGGSARRSRLRRLHGASAD